MSGVRLLLGRPLFRVLLTNLETRRKPQFRKSHVVSYRAAPPPHSKATVIGAEIVGAAMWYWVLWHLWHEYDHITGEFDYPDPSSWTNTELGIPSED